MWGTYMLVFTWPVTQLDHFARHAVIRSGNRENILIDRDVEWKKNAHCESTKGLRMRLAVKNRQNDF